MAIARLVARIEARYTQFDTRKTVRLTERAEKLALTNDERTKLLAFDDARQAAQEAQVEFTPTPEAVKEAEVIKAKLTKAEKAAKAAEKAIKTREIKVARRKARIAAVRYYLKNRTISETITDPDGSEHTVREQIPAEVEEGVEDWKRLGKKVAGFFTYPTDTFRRMWRWARKPISEDIPRWRRPSRIARTIVTAAAIAVLAVPVYVIDFAVNAASSLAMIAGGLALGVAYAATMLAGMVAGLIAKIPFVGKWIALAINVVAGGIAILATVAYAALAVVLMLAALLVKAAINGVLWTLSLPVRGIDWIKARTKERPKEVAAEVSQNEAPVETPAEPVVEVVPEPVIEEPVLTGKIIEPEPKPAPKKAARRKRPVARPNVQVA